MGGGGGGGGEENGLTERSQGTSYRIEPALKVGDKVHVSALVTFDDSIGIPEPVPFEYDLVVKKGVQYAMIDEHCSGVSKEKPSI